MLISVNLYRETHISAGDARCAPIAREVRDKVGHRASHRQVRCNEVNMYGPVQGAYVDSFHAVPTD